MDPFACVRKPAHRAYLHTLRGLTWPGGGRIGPGMADISRLDRIAARQHGVISREQAAEAGLTHSQIQRRLFSGEWVRICSGVYALRSAPATWDRQLSAALLGNPQGLAAGRSAAVLHGFDGFRRARPEILLPFPGNSRSPIARIIRSRHFDVVATTSLRGIPCTTVAETILTLSLREGSNTIERVVDDELAKGSVTVADFDPILERLEYARQPGLGHLRRLVRERSDDAYQPPTSELERLLYGLLDSPELPACVRQVPMGYQSAEATADAYIPSWRLVVEGDGRRWHTRKADFERDRKRDNAAAAEGLLVVRFTYHMLRDDPEGCLRTLLRAGGWRRSA